MKVLTVFGARPEVIKLAPVIWELKKYSKIVSRMCTTQHRQMLDQVLKLFGIKPDWDLNLMQGNNTLFGIKDKITEKDRIQGARYNCRDLYDLTKGSDHYPQLECLERHSWMLEKFFINSYLNYAGTNFSFIYMETSSSKTTNG